MPVTYRLTETNRVRHVVIAEPWDIEVDLLPSMCAFRANLDNATHALHVFLDLRRADHLPIGFIIRVRHEIRLGHPRLGYIAVIGFSLVTRQVLEFACELFQYRRLRLFNTEDEARLFLRLLIDKETEGAG